MTINSSGCFQNYMYNFSYITGFNLIFIAIYYVLNLDSVHTYSWYRCNQFGAINYNFPESKFNLWLQESI